MMQVQFATRQSALTFPSRLFILRWNPLCEFLEMDFMTNLKILNFDGDDFDTASNPVWPEARGGV